MSEPEFVYGYGRTKHIFARREQRKVWGRTEAIEVGLCGAYGGYPDPQPQRPICKRCAKQTTTPTETTEAL